MKLLMDTYKVSLLVDGFKYQTADIDAADEQAAVNRYVNLFKLKELFDAETNTIDDTYEIVAKLYIKDGKKVDADAEVLKG